MRPVRLSKICGQAITFQNLCSILLSTLISFQLELHRHYKALDIMKCVYGDWSKPSKKHAPAGRTCGVDAAKKTMGNSSVEVSQVATVADFDNPVAFVSATNEM